jgi:hypothetical protein
MNTNFKHQFTGIKYHLIPSRSRRTRGHSISKKGANDTSRRYNDVKTAGKSAPFSQERERRAKSR